MTKRTQLKGHINTLNEIGNIMTAIKNLSLIEINKLTKFLITQERVIETNKEVGKDFLSFHPVLFERLQSSRPCIYVLIGSERGFCRNFNDNLVHCLEKISSNLSERGPKFIVVGRKLAMKMLNDERVIQIIDGPSTTEEIPENIANLIKALEQASLAIKIRPHPSYWTIIFNEINGVEIQTKIVRPFVEFTNETSQSFSLEPMLTLPPETFLFEFINHYLFSTLHYVFYKSFSAENYQRSQHLESALDRLQKKVFFSYTQP